MAVHGLNVIPLRLEVSPDWKCQGSGECCRGSKRVTMTFAERRELESAARAGFASRALQFRYNETPGMTDLVAGPCPFVTDDNKCNAYDARPYNCRRFACLRSDVHAEKFDENMSRLKVQTLPLALEIAYRLQTDAQPWADAHGWKKDA